MIVNPASFSERVNALGSRFDGLKLSCSPWLDNGCCFADLATERSDWRTAIMRYEAERCPGLDAKGQVAFLIGDTAHYLLTAIAALYLGEGLVPSLAARDIALVDYDVDWEEDGESGTYKALEVQLFNTTCWAHAPRHLICNAIPLPSQKALRDNLRLQLEQLYHPLIEQLYRQHRLGKAAQWRLVADALAAAFLNVGRQLGHENSAREEAFALIRHPGSPLNNKQTGYFEVTVTDPEKPETPVASQHFRARGGCCRYYTSKAATYCSTCVLLPKTERDARLQAYLQRQYELGAV
ncbi:hypothetical protein [Saccharospirillum sp.]|uniref:hypothetical protein n=1 Tax=Saccharospirillum sp. TaxID=2033801 RepID=UPI0034A0A971